MRRLNLAFALLFLGATAAYGQHTPTLKIRTLTLERLTRISVAEQRRMIRDIKAQTFDSGTLDEIGAQISERLRDSLQRMGFFKAIVYDPRVTLVHEDNRGDLVDVLVAADEGQQYRLKDIVFRGSKAFSPEQLRPLIPLRPGDIFDIEDVRIGLKNLRELYGQNGYLNFTPVPDTQFNDKDRTISLTLDLDEGAIFYLGNLNIAGEESKPGAREKLLQAWKKYKGQRYNSGILSQFLGDVHARPGLNPDHVFETSPDNVNHVVNVYMTLAKPLQ